MEETIEGVRKGSVLPPRKLTGSQPCGGEEERDKSLEAE